MSDRSAFQWAAVLPILGVIVFLGCARQSRIPLAFSSLTHSMEFSLIEDGAYTIRATGEDPYVVCEKVERTFDHHRFSVLCFEYQLERDLDYVEVYFGNPFTQEGHLATSTVPASSGWRPFSLDLSTASEGHWNEEVKDFRLDFGGGGDYSLKIRGLSLRPLSKEEKKVKAAQGEEERLRMEKKVGAVRKTLIAPSKVGAWDSTISATHVMDRGANRTAISVVGRELDLATELRRWSKRVPSPVDLPPAMVVGEGASPRNHTVVRLLNPYGICELQFLSFPPSVRGGVQVEVGTLPEGESFVVAAPLGDDTVRELRLFSEHGNLIESLLVTEVLGPPYAVAVGNFMPSMAGDEIAVASRNVSRNGAEDVSVCPLLVMDLAGREISSVSVDLPKGGNEVHLSTRNVPGGADVLLLHRTGAASLHELDLSKSAAREIESHLPSHAQGVYEAADQGSLVAACREPDFSHILRLSVEGESPQEQDVGERENLFWFNPTGHFSKVPEGVHVKHARFAHIRTDFASPVVTDPNFHETLEEYWAREPYSSWVEERLRTYDQDLPTCWEPCFTHRWFYQQAKKWAEARDEETGLPAYVLVDRENRTGTYGEFGQTNAFVTGTYAPGVKPIECLYTYPQRVFLHELVKRFRKNPEHFVAVEPNHEMEINAESEESYGDYNPNMIRAFYRHMVDLYGGLERINERFQTSFDSGHFDGPRGLGRGEWDRCQADNSYYMAWMRFMNHVIYRVVAGTYREALLAGFPPEAVKCHQIPDLYAISSLTAFSKPAKRVTPIDWMLHAGTGFGFTRYGVWFQREHNCVQGPHSSGFDAMVIGEYQSLTPAAGPALEQLQYLQENGVQFIHCMNWPPGHDKGFNSALEEALSQLAGADQPRLGMTGGTGQIRAVRRDNERAYEVVSLGTGSEHTGLIKSITASGDWEGSVYVVPFHSHVSVESLLESEFERLHDTCLSFGPFEQMGAGQLIDLSFLAKAEGNEDTTLCLRVYHCDDELQEQRVLLPVDGSWRHLRFQLRFQIDTERIHVELGSGDPNSGTWLKRPVSVKDLLATLHTEKAAALKRGIFAGKRHEGGVTFDLLADI